MLYVLNSDGLPFTARPADSSAGPSRQVQAQFDLLNQKIDSGARAFEILANTQDRFAQQLQDNVQRTAASIAGLSTILSASSRLQAEQSQLQHLQSTCTFSQMLLGFGPPAHADTFTQQWRTAEVAVATQQAAVSRAQDSLAAAGHLLPDLPTTSPSLPAPIAQPPATQNRIRSLTEADTDMEDSTRRLRPRLEHSPPRDDSPIRVDSVPFSPFLLVPPIHFPLPEPLIPLSFFLALTSTSFRFIAFHLLPVLFRTPFLFYFLLLVLLPSIRPPLI